MARLFGTDGVRGVANRDLTPELAFRLGFAGATTLAKGTSNRPRVVVGRDTRISGEMLEAALSAGLMSAGADVLRVGVLPTPGVAYLTRTLGADAGVMISASHNPVEDNGIKFFGADGFKLLDEAEDAIENIVRAMGGVIGEAADALSSERPVAGEVGRMIDCPDGVERYIDFLVSTVRSRFDGLRIVLDTANGAASLVAPTVFTRLGADVTLLYGEPNGVNINVRCGSTHPDVIRDAVLASGADLGLAFDGDADRLIAVDDTGEIIDGDRVMVICARAMKAEGRLAKNTVVATVMSNVGFVKATQYLGIHLERTAVGDRYVMEAMRQGGFVLGGEQSGHVIFLEHNTTGDGVLTALQLVDIVVRSKEPLHVLGGVMQTYPQVLINVRVADKTAWRTNAAVQAVMDEVTEKLGDDGRLLVRESGTEPLVRVMAEGPDESLIRGYVDQIVRVMERELGHVPAKV